MGRPVVHWELMSKDPAKVAAFYEKIFDRKSTTGRMTSRAYRTKVVAAGGRIHVEEQAVPGMGAFSLFTDPEGRMMGLWRADAAG